uniref:Uncharacterized protein n=1 Tax=Trichogramma kaykai TaxID=54128 RepID=A0ABD2WBH0_9HYME
MNFRRIYRLNLCDNMYFCADRAGLSAVFVRAIGMHIRIISAEVYRTRVRIRPLFLFVSRITISLSPTYCILHAEQGKSIKLYNSNRLFRALELSIYRASFVLSPRKYVCTHVLIDRAYVRCTGRMRACVYNIRTYAILTEGVVVAAAEPACGTCAERIYTPIRICVFRGRAKERF